MNRLVDPQKLSKVTKYEIDSHDMSYYVQIGDILDCPEVNAEIAELTKVIELMAREIYGRACTGTCKLPLCEFNGAKEIRCYGPSYIKEYFLKQAKETIRKEKTDEKTG